MKKLLLYTSLFVLLLPHVHAQKNKRNRSAKQDTLSVARQFMQVCNIYKKLPLRLSLEITNASNFITSAEDTISLTADFYMIPGHSYIRYGEVEQLGNDSLLLLVSNKLQKMILYPGTQSITSRMQRLTGIGLQDSSLIDLANKYQSQENMMSSDTSMIELTGRTKIPTTSFSSETIRLYYNPVTKNPYQVITIKKSLMGIKENDYQKLLNEKKLSQSLISIDEDKFYLVKEQIAVFSYQQISHDKGIKIPAGIEDRITKKDGEYIPAKGFESFSMIMN